MEKKTAEIILEMTCRQIEIEDFKDQIKYAFMKALDRDDSGICEIVDEMNDDETNRLKQMLMPMMGYICKTSKEIKQEAIH